MNTFQLIQLAMTVLFAISAVAVGVQAERYAKQARASAIQAAAAAARAETALHKVLNSKENEA